MKKSPSGKKPNNSPEITARKRAEGKDLGGRPRFEIDYEILEKLCGIFTPGQDCAVILGCSYETLNLRLQEDYQETLNTEDEELIVKRADGFKKYFALFSAKGRVTLRQKQFLKATKGDGDTQMLKHLGKNYLGQAERIDHTTKGEKLPSSAPTTEMDFTALEDDEFLEFGRMLEKATISKGKPSKEVH